MMVHKNVKLCLSIVNANYSLHNLSALSTISVNGIIISAFQRIVVIFQLIFVDTQNITSLSQEKKFVQFKIPQILKFALK